MGVHSTAAALSSEPSRQCNVKEINRKIILLPIFVRSVFYIVIIHEKSISWGGPKMSLNYLFII